jgi:chromosome segregation ATPase
MNKRPQQRRTQKAAIPKELTQMLASLGSLQEFASVAERLKPQLTKIERFAAELEVANEVLQKIKAENKELRAAIEEQRQTFLRMFATGMDISYEEVLSIESRIQKTEEDANTTTGQISTAETSEADPSTRPT